MKRDPDLIRLILLEVESGASQAAMAHYTKEQILYHIELCQESGFVIAEVHHGLQGQPVLARIQRLTGPGHDFLDAARDEQLWRKVLKQGKTAGGSWSMESLKLLLLEAVRRTVFGS